MSSPAAPLPTSGAKSPVPPGLWCRLFFVLKDGQDPELDLGWVFLILYGLNGIVAFDLAAAGVWTITMEAWGWYGTQMFACWLAGSTLNRARLIAQEKVKAWLREQRRES